MAFDKPVKTQLLEAAKHHFLSQKKKAEAELQLLLAGPAGVGDHTVGVVGDEFIKGIKNLDEANSNLETIESLMQE